MPRHPLTLAICASTGLVALPAACLTGLGLLPGLQLWHVRASQLASFVHLGGLLWSVVAVGGLLGLIRLRGWASAAIAIIALVGVAVHGLWLAPYFRAGPPPVRPALEVTMLNVEFGYSDVELLARAMAGSDVVVLLEMTPETVAALSRVGMDRRFPHRAGHGAPGAAGTVIYSRLPMTDLGSGPPIWSRDWCASPHRRVRCWWRGCTRSTRCRVSAPG